jgi:hypothetical protein
VFFIRDDLLIKVIDMDLLLTVCSPQQINEALLEFLAEILDVFAGVFADDEHLADMAFASHVAFETC